MLFIVIILTFVVSIGGEYAFDTKFVVFPKLLVEFGQNIGHHVHQRLIEHFTKIPHLHVEYVNKLVDYHSIDENNSVNTLYLSFGNGSQSLNHIPASALSSVPDESFQVHIDSSELTKRKKCFISVNGNPLAGMHQNASFNKHAIHYGAVTGSYYVMELLGYGFFHPLQPYSPPQIYLDHKYIAEAIEGKIEIVEKPYWPERGFHLHTQHPLELTEVLQGHDIPHFGPHGPHCRQFSKRSYPGKEYEKIEGEAGYYCERWEDMVIDVDYFYEWAIANRLNRVEWLLLGHYEWNEELAIRMHRLQLLTTLGHQYSLLIGADVPIGNVQQHAWHMVNVRLQFPEQVKQIQERVDWIFHAGFDFLTTESGLSEFTHPECDLMLDLLNAFAGYINEIWHRETAIKVHCSTGQKCESYLDPRTGDPINFNFLPTFAHQGLGVLPHTVQVYAFDDPTSGTYGNSNFQYVEDYLVYEAKEKKRPVIFYGETSYWVNYDIDVPLFLPIYGQRRQKDLRKIAIREQVEDFRIQGQMNFDSGWEWTYWMNDVITARSSWNPNVKESDGPAFQQCTQDAFTHINSCPPYSDEWEIFAESLSMISRVFGPQYQHRFNELVVNIARSEIELLVLGQIEGRPNPNIKKLTGIAYLCGTDTWVDLPRALGLAFTQPDKVHMKESTDPNWPYVIELLQAMDKTFGQYSKEMDALYHDMWHTYQAQQRHAHAQSQQQQTEGVQETSFLLSEHTLHIMIEFQQSMKLLSLRAKQVKLLYESSDSDLLPTSTLKKKLQLDSRMVLEEATEIVQTREQLFYRVAWERIASWRENPTVYRFGYLWSVHALYYWWRDQGLAEQSSRQSQHSPCYLNRMDSTEVAVGWGKYYLQLLRHVINNYTPFASFYPLEIVNCLSPPPREYEFPKDMYYIA